jgi:hypothetical protein
MNRHFIKQQIVEMAIIHWNEKMAGTTALEIAKKFNISHEESLLFFEELQSEGKGTFNKIGVLPLSTDISNNGINIELSERNSKTTYLFIPAKDILERYYYNNLCLFIQNGEYTNRLYRGNHPLQLIYFKINVLNEYFDHIEMYSITDDITGGVIRLNQDYIAKLTDEEINTIWFDKFHYGKRKLQTGEFVVTAILKDLSCLKKKGQLNWFSFELENPIFSQNDEDFNSFTSSALGGNFIEINDPIQDITTEMENLNKIFNNELFSESKNPNLRYPINNTYKDFVHCNSELFKLIGPDNFRLNTVKEIYLKYCKGKKEDFKHKKSGRNLSQTQILYLIFNKLNPNLTNVFEKHWEKVKQNRIEDDHKITIPKHSDENYIDIFRQICNDTKNILISIRNEFKKITP